MIGKQEKRLPLRNAHVRTLGLAAALLLGCGTVTSTPPDGMPAPGEPDASMPTGAVDASSEPDAPPQTDPDPIPTCTPGTSVCADDALKVCNESGQYGAPTPCPLGCFTDGTRCWDVMPSAGLTNALDGAIDGPGIVLSDGASFHFSGAVRDGNGTEVTIPSVVVDQGTLPAVRVFKVRSLKMGRTSIASSIAIASHGPISIHGPVAIGQQNVGCSGGAAGVAGAGGGGGMSGSGGRGGNGAPGPTPGSGGAALPASHATSLRGGCRGGNMGYSDMDEGWLTSEGAWAGGALHIISRHRIELVAEGGSVGSIDAGGAAGWYGAGGGSGGLILLEAPEVALAAPGVVLAANGGAGGAVCDGGYTEVDLTPPIGGVGEPGFLGDRAALGGRCANDANYFGGAGGYGVIGSGTTNGQNGSGNDGVRFGGGGGAAGLIRINTRAGGFSRVAGTVVTPRTTKGPDVGLLGRR